MDREDWEQAIRTPLGILPGGSGNALAASVHHYSQWVRPQMNHLNAWISSIREAWALLILLTRVIYLLFVIIRKSDLALQSSGGWGGREGGRGLEITPRGWLCVEKRRVFMRVRLYGHCFSAGSGESPGAIFRTEGRKSRPHCGLDWFFFT